MDAALMGALWLVVAGTVAACEPSMADPGVSGKVTGKREKYDPATKTEDHLLTIDGREYRVRYETWESCEVGSPYPTCK